MELKSQSPSGHYPYLPFARAPVFQTFMEEFNKDNQQALASTRGLGLYPHQEYISRYLNRETPYRGLVLFHGLGSGKTASASATINGYPDRDVVLLTKASLSGRKSFTDASSPKELSAFAKDLVRFGFRGDLKSARKRTTIVHYKTVATLRTLAAISGIRPPNKQTDAIWYLTQMRNRNPFDGKLVIVDEAHNLSEAINNAMVASETRGKLSDSWIIYHLLTVAKDCRVILLSGTPAVNRAYTLGILVNMVTGRETEAVFKLTRKFTTEGFDKVFQKTRGMVSYTIVKNNRGRRMLRVKLPPAGFERSARGEGHLVAPKTGRKNDLDFKKIAEGVGLKFVGLELSEARFPEPVRLVGDTLQGVRQSEMRFITEHLRDSEYFQTRCLGAVSYLRELTGDDFPSITTEQLPLVMENRQLVSYCDAWRRENRRTSGAEDKLQSGMFKVLTSQAGLFTFPKGTLRPVRKSDDDKTYKTRLNAAIKAIPDSVLQRGKSLREHSVKYDEFLRQSASSNGPIIAYTRLLNGEGVYALKEVLKRNGYEEATSGKSTPAVGSAVRFKMADGKFCTGYVTAMSGDRASVAYIGEDEQEKIHMALRKDITVARFATFSGELTMEEKDRIMQVFRADDNRNGESVFALLITEAGTEGLNTRFVRQVHVLEPYWHRTRIRQLIGRARRSDSHTDLPESERHVHVYEYLSTFPPNAPKDCGEVSADISIDRISRKKQNELDVFMDDLSSASVDCALRKTRTPCFKKSLNSLDDLRYLLQNSLSKNKGVLYPEYIADHLTRYTPLAPSSISFACDRWLSGDIYALDFVLPVITNPRRVFESSDNSVVVPQRGGDEYIANSDAKAVADDKEHTVDKKFVGHVLTWLRSMDEKRAQNMATPNEMYIRDMARETRPYLADSLLNYGNRLPVRETRDHLLYFNDIIPARVRLLGPSNALHRYTDVARNQMAKSAGLRTANIYQVSKVCGGNQRDPMYADLDEWEIPLTEPPRMFKCAIDGEEAHIQRDSYDNFTFKQQSRPANPLSYHSEYGKTGRSVTKFFPSDTFYADVRNTIKNYPEELRRSSIRSPPGNSPESIIPSGDLIKRAYLKHLIQDPLCIEEKFQKYDMRLQDLAKDRDDELVGLTYALAGARSSLSSMRLLKAPDPDLSLASMDDTNDILTSRAKRLEALSQASTATARAPLAGGSVPPEVKALRQKLESLLRRPKELRRLIDKATIEKGDSLYARDSVRHRVLCVHWKSVAQGLPTEDIIARFSEMYEGGEEVCKHCGHIFRAGKRVAASTFDDDGNVQHSGRDVWREVTEVSLPQGPIYDIMFAVVYKTSDYFKVRLRAADLLQISKVVVNQATVGGFKDALVEMDAVGSNALRKLLRWTKKTPPQKAMAWGADMTYRAVLATLIMMYRRPYRPTISARTSRAIRDAVTYVTTREETIRSVSKVFSYLQGTHTVARVLRKNDWDNYRRLEDTIASLLSKFGIKKLKETPKSADQVGTETDLAVGEVVYKKLRAKKGRTTMRVVPVRFERTRRFAIDSHWGNYLRDPVAPPRPSDITLHLMEKASRFSGRVEQPIEVLEQRVSTRSGKPSKDAFYAPFYKVFEEFEAWETKLKTAQKERDAEKIKDLKKEKPNPTNAEGVALDAFKRFKVSKKSSSLIKIAMKEHRAFIERNSSSSKAKTFALKLSAYRRNIARSFVKDKPGVFNDFRRNLRRRFNEQRMNRELDRMEYIAEREGFTISYDLTSPAEAFRIASAEGNEESQVVESMSEEYDAFDQNADT